jgi:hypothetical protein
MLSGYVSNPIGMGEGEGVEWGQESEDEGGTTGSGCSLEEAIVRAARSRIPGGLLHREQTGRSVSVIARKNVDTIQSRPEALVAVAADWREPDHPPREEAVAETVEAPNRWTEEALDYALNRWMQRLTLEALTDWLGDIEPDAPTPVGVLHGSADPLEGLRDAVAVWASGHTYLGHTADASPALLPTFTRELKKHHEEQDIEFVDEEALFDRATAVMAQPDRGNVDTLQQQCDSHGIPQKRRLVRPTRLAIAVLDGHENDDARGGIAEDLLLYEGGGHRRLALVWAPTDLSPDSYLEAMARFRGVFPVHEDTPGALQMQKAFLEARDEPRAYAEGLEFLVSRGAPEFPQPDGHIRWTEYENLDEVDEWIEDHQDALYAVVARGALHDQFPRSWPLRTPGGLHIPPINDEEGAAIAAFVRGLGEN